MSLKSIFILCGIFISTLASASESKPYRLKFKIDCSILEQHTLYADVILSLRGSKSEKFYSLTCLKNSKTCYGTELRLTDGTIGLASLIRQEFQPQNIHFTKTTATILYNNVSISVDKESGLFKLIAKFDEGSKSTEEIWEGSCK